MRCANLLNTINNLLPISFRTKMLAEQYYKGTLQRKIYNGEPLKDLVDDALSVYLVDAEKKDKKLIKKLVKDIIYCQLQYKMKPNEYFNFGFRYKESAIRETYISDQQRVELLLKLNGAERKFELRDKYVFFKLAQSFFKRRVFHLDIETGVDTFSDFCLSVKKIFCKPNRGAMGAGICSFQVENKENAQKIYKDLLKAADDWIIEEAIIQGKELAEWNDTSINTIRFPSFLKDGHFIVYYPKIRVGRKGQIVDNFSQGGMIAMIDWKSGVICTDAYTKANNLVVVHPDSGKPFKGEHIPHWKELLEYAEALHRSMPQHIYVAWDFAYTTNGWDIVEANWGQLGSTQMMLGRGVKDEFEKLASVK